MFLSRIIQTSLTVFWLSKAYWCERPELFAAIADATTDEDRSVAVLKWFIVSAAASVCSSGG